MRSLTLLLVIVLVCPTSPKSARIPVYLEHAVSLEERFWGLMGRQDLDENQGMLFHNPDKRITRIWALNCYFPLSVAFLEDNGTILEIKQLEAYPELMSYCPIIKNLDDFMKLPDDDPILDFFRKRGVVSSKPVRYILEMEKGWFKEHGVKPGDRLHWRAYDREGCVEIFN